MRVLLVAMKVLKFVSTLNTEKCSLSDTEWFALRGFISGPIPENEAERLQAVRDYQILDTLPEQAFDDATILASQICNAPIALISIVDHDRQWFKSKVGLSVSETKRDISFCAHALQDSSMLVVPDTHADERFAGNPLVTGNPHIRFYAGAPLISSKGHSLGTLCVIDHRPRELTPEQLRSLEALSRQVMGQLELRRQLAEQLRMEAALRESEERLGLAIKGADLGLWDLDLKTGKAVYNPRFAEMLGYTLDEIEPQSNFWETLVHPEDKAMALAQIHEHWGGRTPIFDCELRLRACLKSRLK